MTKRYSINKTKYCFYILIVFSIIWTIFVPKPLKNYSPIFFGLSFGILFFLYFDGVMNVSNSIRIKYPELFKKYLARHDLIEIHSLIKSNDFDNLNDELTFKIQVIKYFLKLSIVSFLLTLIFGIIVVILK
jgi:hypothetical protein